MSTGPEQTYIINSGGETHQRTATPVARPDFYLADSNPESTLNLWGDRRVYTFALCYCEQYVKI